MISFMLYYFALIILSKQINETTKFYKDLTRKLIILILSFL